MKFLKSSLIIFSILFLAACGGEEKSDSEGNETKDETVDTEGMSDLPLSEHGLNLVIKTPPISSSTGSILPSVHHEEGSLDWTVKIGDKFEMIIEEWSPEHDPNQKVAEEKKYVENSVFEIEFLTDEDDLIMYKRTLPEGQGGKTSYHVYSAQKIDGITYVFKSGLDGGLKPIIEDMVKTIKTVQSSKSQPA